MLKRNEISVHVIPNLVHTLCTFLRGLWFRQFCWIAPSTEIKKPPQKTCRNQPLSTTKRRRPSGLPSSHHIYLWCLACCRKTAISRVPPTGQSSSAPAFRNDRNSITMRSNNNLRLLLTPYRYRGTTPRHIFYPRADRRYRMKSTRRVSVCTPSREIRFLFVLQNCYVCVNNSK